MRIRAASSEHVEEMAELLGLLFAQEADFTPDRMRQRAALLRIVEDPSCGRILVAAGDDGRVLGMVSLLPSISTAEGGPVFWLEDMVVRPEVRGLGVGRALLDEAVALARELGGTRISLLTDAANQGAIRFYRRQGFRVSAMIPLRRPV